MKRRPTIQIRPSVSVDVAAVLEELAKSRNQHLGKVLEELLYESKTFKKVKEAINRAVKEAAR